jgi:hypothetical protein
MQSLGAAVARDPLAGESWGGGLRPAIPSATQ